MSRRAGRGRPTGQQQQQQFRPAEKPDTPVELENQFILRLPPSEPSLALREAIRSGASNLKERLFIQLEPEKVANTQASD